MELISAYTDGELPEHDNRRVKEHIGACESCSALLKIYREISVSVDESCVHVPEALRTGVMESILSDGVVSARDNTQSDARKHKPFRIIILRYAPIAACLAVILLAMPWFVNSLNHRSFDSGAPMLMSDMNKSSQTDADSGGTDTGEALLEALYDDMIIVGRNDAALEPVPAPAPAADAPSADPDTTRAAGAGPNDASKFTHAEADAPADAPEMAADTSNAQNGESGLRADWSDDETELDGAHSSMFIPEPEAAVGLQEPPVYAEAPGAILSILDDFSDAYAWIEITGELPKILGAYDPEPLDDWLSWEVYYEIPTDAAQKLIKEISGSDGVSVTYNYNNGKYAIVFYSP